MDSVKVDVIIPTFHPKERFLALMEQLEKQVLAVNRIVIVNTEKKAFETLMDCDTFLKEHPKAMLFHISQDEFDHGKTRNLAVSNSDAEVFVCMTQDALPADAYLTPMQDNFRKKIAAEWNAIRGSSITRSSRRSKQRRIF